MVKIREDMTGWVMSEHGFPDSRIIVVKQAEDYISPQGCRYAQWWCKCTCGKTDLFVVKARELRSGDTKSCGCLRIEKHKKFNNFELNLKDEYGKYGVGYCSNTNTKFYFDMEDYNKIKDYCWYETNCGEYHTMEAWDKKTQTQTKMYWLITGKYCDHADRSPFNNRKYNLRYATASQNSSNRTIGNRNSSGIIGVMFDKSRKKWCSHIGINNQKIRLGRFVDKTDAIKARLKAEQKYFGEFAPQRHLFKEYGIEEGNNE
jgi:hypothetical protein